MTRYALIVAVRKNVRRQIGYTKPDASWAEGNARRDALFNEFDNVLADAKQPPLRDLPVATLKVLSTHKLQPATIARLKKACSLKAVRASLKTPAQPEHRDAPGEAANEARADAANDAAIAQHIRDMHEAGVA